MSNTKRLINQFTKLVTIDSPTGEEDLIANYLINYFRENNSIVRKDDFGNVYVKIDGRGRPIFLSAHMDTVQPGKNIRPKIKNGYIISDGKTILGADNKATISVILEAIEIIKQNGIEHLPIELVFTRSEEIGNYGAVNFNYGFLQSKNGYCFDLGQPVGTVAIASPFYERFDIKIFGRSAHASDPDHANNILKPFSQFVLDLPIGQINKNTLINIGVVSSGVVRNTIPGEIIFKGEIRSLIENDLLFQKQKLISLLNKVCDNNNLICQVDFVRENNGYYHKSREIMSFIGQMKLRPIISWDVSDANIFNEKNLTCLNLGDGVENAHTMEEKISINQLLRLTALIIELVRI